MKLRLLIVDDEPLARTRLRTLVEELGHEVCAEAADRSSAERALAEVQPDAILLDVEMPGGNGLTLAQRMEMGNAGVPVVLVTAHAEHAVAAFDAGVADYVLKPVRKDRLGKALEKVIALHSGERRAAPLIRLTVGRKERLVPLDEIDCFVAEDGYVVARSERWEGFVDASLNDLEVTLKPHLVRVHRSCLAIIDAVAGIEHGEDGTHRLLFKDGQAPVPISRRRVATAKVALKALASTT